MVGGNGGGDRAQRAVLLPKAVVQQDRLILHDVAAVTVEAYGIPGLRDALREGDGAQQRAEVGGSPLRKYERSLSPLSGMQPFI